MQYQPLHPEAVRIIARVICQHYEKCDVRAYGILATYPPGAYLNMMMLRRLGVRGK